MSEQLTREGKPAFFTVAIYLVDKSYGGPEEGGWWYQHGTRVDETLEGMQSESVLKVFVGEDAEKEAEKATAFLNEQLDETINKGRRDIGSVLSEGRYNAELFQGYPPEFYPATKPHYE